MAGVVTGPARFSSARPPPRARRAARSRPDLTAATTDAAPGWFGPDSMTWRVHADRSMLIGGSARAFLQVLHPLAMAGVADHSSYREDPLGRSADVRASRPSGSSPYEECSANTSGCGTLVQSARNPPMSIERSAWTRQVIESGPNQPGSTWVTNARSGRSRGPATAAGGAAHQTACGAGEHQQRTRRPRSAPVPRGSPA